jgi:TP901 family phage tail tape measure protein
MSKQFVIPSIFTAVDQLSAPVNQMAKTVDSFGSRAEIALAKSNRMFRKLTPTLGDASRQLLSFASTAAIGAGIVSTAKFSVDSLKEYETAVASFRTIVSDATDKEFAAYEKKMGEVANTTQKSSIEVAASFEKIAGLNSAFAETADGLGAVSQAAITLAKASGMELGSSAESLVGIMNQFSMGALEADRAINVLAAGQAVGAANIQQTAESFVNFGATAAGANITLEQSVGLIQTLGKFSLFGAEAGTKLRGAVTKLQQANVGYASGQFNINDALVEARGRIDKLSTAKEKDEAITKMFGMENMTAGRILLNNIDTYEEFTKGVTGTSEAQKAAQINSQSLSVKLDELKNRWINIITSSDGASKGLEAAKRVIGFVTDNMDTLLTVGLSVLGFFTAWKVLNLTTAAAIGVYNVAIGIQGALTGITSVAVGSSTVALAAYNVTTKIVTASTWLWNTAQTALNFILTANPIGLVIVAIAALIAIIVLIANKTTGWAETWDSALKWMGSAIDLWVATAKIYFFTIEHAFLSMVDGIVLAWKWGQNAIGLLSDEQYAKDKAQIAATSAARIAGIKEQIAAAGVAATEVAKGVDWQVKMKSDGVDVPALNQKQAENNSVVRNLFEGKNNFSLDVNLNDPKLVASAASNNVNAKTTSSRPY